ncbi:MAG: VWA domain-containing protein [Thermoanaerobaculia bacterium]
MAKRAFLLLLLPLLAGAVLPAAASEPTKAQKEAVAQLPETYRSWMEMVAILLSDEERATFLALQKDYQRDAFIKRFWAERDTNKRTARNEFQERWEANAKMARDMFGDLNDGRSRVLLLNGPPAERVESQCSAVLWPLEAWFYPTGSDRLKEPFALILYRKWGVGNFRLWNPLDGAAALINDTSVLQTGGDSDGAVSRGGASGVGDAKNPARGKTGSTVSIMDCGSDDHAKMILAAMRMMGSFGMSWFIMEAKLDSAPDGPGAEWVSAFSSYSTDVPEGASPLPAKLDLSFPGRMQNRTMLQGVLTVPPGAAGLAELGDARSHNLLLNGEVLYQGELFDSFRYRFDLPAGDAPESLPLAFERPLRPGEYTLIVKLEDVNSGKVFREERALAVPLMEAFAPSAFTPRTPEEAETARILAEANAALRSGETTVRLIPPAGELQTGMQRFDTLTTGPGIASVTFSLDGKPVLTKKSPPFSVELDLGKVPRTRTLSVAAFDAAGGRLATDDLAINATSNRFRVRLLEPQRSKRYESSLLARAEVDVPEGERIERVEFFLNEARVATLYQPPYVQPMMLPRAEPIAYVRAVAFLSDGNATESLVFVNAPDDMAQINVDLVELYTTVLDRQGRPVASGLEARDFTVAEDGARQEIARFERVTDLPIHAAVAIDVSASMADALEEAQSAALQFLQRTIRPKDRAAVITFNDHPMLAVKFTRDVKALAGGLAGLKAERGTALYDSLIFSFYNFNGLRGRRALLLLSDGKDEGSRFTWEEALEYARRAGVTVYAIGLGDKVEKGKLSRISEETGGRAFFPKKADELAAIYAAIEEELRSQYLIAYQSTTSRTDPGFRMVDLKVKRSGLEAKTIRGYYP